MTNIWQGIKSQKDVEMRGIEPRAFHMQSERSTTELHPRMLLTLVEFPYEQRVIGSYASWFLSHSYVYGHIMLKAPVLVRSCTLLSQEMAGWRMRWCGWLGTGCSWCMRRGWSGTGTWRTSSWGGITSTSSLKVSARKCQLWIIFQMLVKLILVSFGNLKEIGKP